MFLIKTRTFFINLYQVQNTTIQPADNKKPSLLWFPIVICLAMLALYIIFGNSLKTISHGIFPRTISGLQGIVFSPFIHDDWGHLLSNLMPMLVLGLLMFGMYRDIAFRVFFLIYVLTGLWVWIVARPSYHIGASGIVYGLWAFVLMSGFLRQKKELIVISLLVAFLYGSMFWGLFPIMPAISFESHLSGMLAGFMCAVYYLRQGPQKPKYFEDEPDDEPDDPEAPWNQPYDENGEPLEKPL